MALDRECGQVAILIANGPLLEPRGEIDGGEDGGVGSADVADAFVDFLHGVLVGVDLLVEASEVLHNAQASPLS